MYDIPVKWLLIEVNRNGGQENPLVVREQVDICPNWPSTLVSLITAKFSAYAAKLVVESWYWKSNRGCLNLYTPRPQEQYYRCQSLRKLPGCCKEAKWKCPELVSHWVYHKPEVLVDIWRYYDMWVGIHSQGGNTAAIENRISILKDGTSRYWFRTLRSIIGQKEP